jgi:long-chain acyl-CoA synthetase
MTVALICGDTVLSETALHDRIEATPAGVDVPGRVVPILESDRVDALVKALAVRRAGGVPVIGDDRWDATYWDGLRRQVESAAPAPGMAWGTFTSGSTGTPRMIVRTDESWSASFPAIEKLTGLTSEDVLYLPSPLVSSVTMFSVSHARALGATVLLPRTHTVSDGDLRHATVMHGTPYALRDILERVEAGTPHRLRVALIGGARLDPGLRSRAEAAGIDVVSYYGAAELSFVAVDTDGRGLWPIDGVELRADEGVLWVRSAYFAGGYLGGGPFQRDADGWGTVGDLVDGDATGPLRLLGRSDGAILTAAATVVPEDVEAALQRIDGIAEAVVFALPNTRAGSLVAAVIEPQAGQRPPTAGELRARTNALLTATHRPRRWFWTDQLPRTAAGKPAREQIRRDAIEGRMARIV